MLLFEKTPRKANKASQGNRLFPDQRSSHLSERRGRRQAIRRDQTQRDRRHEKKKELREQEARQEWEKRKIALKGFLEEENGGRKERWKTKKKAAWKRLCSGESSGENESCCKTGRKQKQER